MQYTLLPVDKHVYIQKVCFFRIKINVVKKHWWFIHSVYVDDVPLYTRWRHFFHLSKSLYPSMYLWITVIIVVYFHLFSLAPCWQT